MYVSQLGISGALYLDVFDQRYQRITEKRSAVFSLCSQLYNFRHFRHFSTLLALLLLVVVKSSSALSAEPARIYILDQERAGPVLGIPQA
jgi:hypothetical protein